MKLNKRIRTVLYGDQRFSSAELELLHTHAFQRLYDLHQLGLTDRVFIDASHSRLHHVVGVVEQATNLMESLAGNLKNRPDVELEYSEGPHAPAPTAGQFAALVKRRIPAARLMALLHDLTHAPYGHTLEDEIRLVEEKHDEPARQAEAFYRVALQFFGWLVRNSLLIPDLAGAPTVSEESVLYSHLSEYLDRPDFLDPREDAIFIEFVASRAARLIQSADERRTKQPFLKLGTQDLTSFAKEMAFAMRALLFLEVAHKEEVKLRHIPAQSYPFDELFTSIFEKLGATPLTEDVFLPHRDAFMLDVIGNTICADLLDYAKRDAVNAGLKLDYDASRIIQNFTLISHSSHSAKVTDGAAVHPFQKHSIRTAISLFGQKLRIDVAGELLNLLQVRYYVYERMLFHPTKCIAGAMLGAAVQLVGWKSFPVHFRLIGDAVFLHDARSAAKLVLTLLESDTVGSDPYTIEVCNRLKSKLEAIPLTSVTQAAKTLLDDRVVQVKDVKAKLELLQYLKDFRAASSEILQILKEPSYSADQPFDARTRVAVLDQLPQKDSEFRAKAESLLSALVPNTAAIAVDIRAGLRLFSRLLSRKFFKAVFRLLPDVKVLKARNIDAGVIAKKFQDSTTRYVAEREIERRAGLPVGTVAIHCPSADGPKKTANILITPGIVQNHGDLPKAVPLYNIGELHPPIFRKHQKAIEAFQDMYKSMWRLAVSVAPPHTVEWKAVSLASGNVISEILTQGDDVIGPAENDEYMKVEIENSLSSGCAAASIEMASIQMPDGSEREMSLSRFRFLEEIATILESVDGFSDVLKPQDGEPTDPSVVADSILQFRALVKGKDNVTPLPAPNRGRSRKRDKVSVPSLFDGHQEPLNGPQIDKLTSEFDAVLALYRPTIAEKEWDAIQGFRQSFLQEAGLNPQPTVIIGKLQRLRFTSRLIRQEHVERNSGKAAPIIEELKGLLG